MRSCVIVAALWILPARVEAHSVGVDCSVKGDRVELEAYFDDDTPAAKARLRVLAVDGVIAEGQTDAQGKWTFPRPAPGRYEVVVDAGAGHRHRTRITIPDPAAPAEAPMRVSEAPGRSEATRVPWLQLLVGVVIIAGGSALLVLFSRLRRGRRADEEVDRT